MIDKSEIERVKRANDLIAIIRSRGVKLARKGKQLVGLCPFHDDHEPSLIVDPAKQLWNCLGACKEGGDVYRFVMKAEGVDFREAHLRLGGIEAEAQASHSVDDLEWLERAVEHYHKTLLHTPSAQEYLRSRGLSAPEIVTTFRLGYADGTLIEKLPAEGKAALQQIGVLGETGREMMAGCVVFPLVRAETGQVVSLYGRHTERRQHLYLPGQHRGLFNPQGARNTSEVLLTESVIDAAALWSLGLRNVVPVYGTNGLTEEIISHLEECRIKQAVLIMDSDEAGRAAARDIKARLEQINISARSVELPAKDAAEFVATGGSEERARALICEPEAAANTEEEKPKIETASDGSISFTFDTRLYRIRGLTASGLDRLKVNVRISVGQAFHLDTLDLYQARARSLFAQSAARVCRVEERKVAAELMEIIERKASLSKREASECAASIIMYND